MQFENLQLIDPLLRAVRAEGYDTPTPIQEQAIPHVLSGGDLIGCAQTGTGKTAAFALPILQHIEETQTKSTRGVIRALILSPTRELALQINDSFRTYGRYTKIRSAVIYGGVKQHHQEKSLKKGVDILVATPGRLLDLAGQKIVDLSRVEIFVLDEADRMLDMGFIHDMRRVVKLMPHKRQTLLFSATMPPAIQEFAQSITHKPIMVEVTPQSTTVEKIDQSVFFVDKRNKRALLQHLLTDDHAAERVLVFTRTKHGANRLVQQLSRADIQAEAIHGNKSQSAREKALSNFKKGKIRALVATDIASRGIDVDDVTHVVNYDLPNEPESYVHRIGRTARAGASGVAYSFCDSDERKYLRDIEKLIRERVPVVDDHPFPLGTANSDGNGGNNGNQQKKQTSKRSASNNNNGNDGSGKKNNNKRRRRNRNKQKAANPRNG